MTLTIVVDAMGGDNAPQEPVIGSAAFALENPDINVLLTGQEGAVRDVIASQSLQIPSNLEIVHAEEIVGMEESPVSAVKEKKDSSIARAVQLVKDGKADALISAGNTGVVVAQCILELKRIPNIKRPGIINPFPSEKGLFYMLDAGANSESKPEYLFQHALLGAVYCKYFLEKEKPTVALLNIGTEETKGNELVREANKLINEIEDPFFEYKGYVEGSHLFQGDYDLVVCEGFVGNVVLKLAEGISKSIFRIISSEVTQGTVRKVGAALLKNAFGSIKTSFDYEYYGGAMLIGINGICTILHGASSRISFTNGLKTTSKFCEKEIIMHLKKYISLLKKEN
ncbi:phosphate acyltransferase PlsX [Planctomycetota bacterium]